MAKPPIVWVTAIISPKKITTVERDLLKSRLKGKHRGVKAYIPTVKILTKQVKGKRFYDTLPMLFNYAFFRVPKYYIPNHKFLEDLKKDMECILSWVKDPCLPQTRLYNPLGVAIVSDFAIRNLETQEEKKTFYTAKDLNRIKKGDIITLHGYPFEGLPVEIIKVVESKQYVSVRLLLETSIKLTRVSFDNVFYSIYKDVYTEDSMHEESIDDFKARHKGIENSIEGKDERTKSESLGDFRLG